MTYRPHLRVPFGYGTASRTLAEVREWLLEHHHPEFIERFLAWLDWCDGLVGPGGGWRSTQPAKPGFAPEGKSFHQDQEFPSGTYACAVDVVRLNPDGGAHLTVRWSDVPKQGTPEALIRGVHANVDQGAMPESWHIQATDIDGWQTWVNQGRPDLLFGYPFPGRNPPTPEPEPIPEDDMADKLFLGRTEDIVSTPTREDYHIRRGDGNVATVLRSREYDYLKYLYDNGMAPPFYNRKTGELIKNWATIPVYSETEMDLLVGYVDGDSLKDEG